MKMFASSTGLHLLSRLAAIEEPERYGQVRQEQIALINIRLSCTTFITSFKAEESGREERLRGKFMNFNENSV